MGNLQSLVQCSITSVILFIYLWILFEAKWNNSPYCDRTELINGLKIYLQKQGTELVWITSLELVSLRKYGILSGT